MEAVEILRIIVGSIYVLFLPGLVWSFVFFNKGEIDWIERIALSFGLSIALVPLSVFWMNYLFKIKINIINVSIIIAILILVPLIYLVRKLR
ncbi:MAG: DUF1616 domain-containing protein [Archaeoglobus sp.]|nr:DUF1616 domain-containing protein [Archaeoglobus sp.]